MRTFYLAVGTIFFLAAGCGWSEITFDRECSCLEEEKGKKSKKGWGRTNCENDRVPGSVLESLSILPLDGGGAVLASFKF